MSSLVMGLSPPHGVINVGDDQQEWLTSLTLLHLIATHRPAHLQHEYTTIQTQVGDVLPVKSFPAMETATMIMLGKYKQGEVWMEGADNAPCPEEVCRQDKYQLKDGYLIPANNQFSCFELNYKVFHSACKRGAHCCDLYLAET